MLAKADIEKYFTAERRESLLFIFLGIFSVTIAILGLYVVKTAFCKGASIPMIVVGLIQISVGYTVYRRTDDDILRVNYALEVNPVDLKMQELPRMILVNRNFIWYQYIEIGLAILGAVLMLMNHRFSLLHDFRLFKTTFWFGVGLALTIQSLLMFWADVFAKKRALEYTKQLKAFIQSRKVA